MSDNPTPDPGTAPVAAPLPTMAKWLVFDTETTHLPDDDKPADDIDQPRLAAIHMVFLDEDLRELWSYSRYIKPDGWEISPGAFEKNRLTTEFLASAGVPVNEVLDVYCAAIRNGCSVAAFNSWFDAKIMRGELRRAGRDDLFEETKRICLMNAMGDWNKSEGRSGRRTSLEKALDAIGYQRVGQAHTAASDATAAVALMRFLHDRGAVPEPKVYYKRGVTDATVRIPK